jgi:hypothetical protein
MRFKKNTKNRTSSVEYYFTRAKRMRFCIVLSYISQEAQKLGIYFCHFSKIIPTKKIKMMARFESRHPPMEVVFTIDYG